MFGYDPSQDGPERNPPSGETDYAPAKMPPPRDESCPFQEEREGEEEPDPDYVDSNTVMHDFPPVRAECPVDKNAVMHASSHVDVDPLLGLPASGE